MKPKLLPKLLWVLVITSFWVPAKGQYSPVWAQPFSGRTGMGAVSYSVNGYTWWNPFFRVHCIGGYNGTAFVNTNEFFETQHNWPPGSWQTAAPMPTARGYCAAIKAQTSKIYVIGGLNAGGFLNTVEEYDVVTNSWTTRTPMPTARAKYGSAYVNGKIYIYGGENNSGVLNVVEEYDPVTDTWTTKAPMPSARSRLASSSYYYGGVYKAYAMGGINSLITLTPTNTNFEYNPTTNTWATRAAMPVALANFAAVHQYGQGYGLYMVDEIFVTGGGISTMYRYSALTNTWSPIISGAFNGTPRYENNLVVIHFESGCYSYSVLSLGGYVSPGTLVTQMEYSVPLFALPENEINFIASSVGNTATLSWDINLDSEVNEFQLERANETVNFLPVGSPVKAGVTGKAEQKDANLSAGIYYYRLRIVKADGSIAYSGHRKIEITGEAGGIRVFPNPASDFCMIDFAPTEGVEGVKILLVSMEGKTVTERSLTNAELTSGKIQLGLAGISPGHYLVRLVIPGTESESTLIVQ